MMPGDGHHPVGAIFPRRAARRARGAGHRVLPGGHPAVCRGRLLVAVVLLGGSPAADCLCFLRCSAGRRGSGPGTDGLPEGRGGLGGSAAHRGVADGALWVIRQTHRLQAERKALPFTGVESSGRSAGGRAWLASLFISPGPWLTLFRSLQLLTMVLFGFLWVEKLGSPGCCAACSGATWLSPWSSPLLRFFRPELVFAGERVRGDYIADTGAAGAMGIILLVSYTRPACRAARASAAGPVRRAAGVLSDLVRLGRGGCLSGAAGGPPAPRPRPDVRLRGAGAGRGDASPVRTDAVGDRLAGP